MKHTTWKKPSRRARTAQLIQQAYEVTAPRSADVVIVGGGAAGLACARRPTLSSFVASFVGDLGVAKYPRIL